MAAEMVLTISAMDKASAVVKGVEDAFDGFKGKVKGAIDSIKDNFTSLHFAVKDAMALIAKAFAAVERFAAFEEVRNQLNKMAGQFNMTGDSIVAAMKRVTDGQFSLEQATTGAATALKQSLTPEQILGLATAAATFADVAGVDVPTAFNALVDAVGKGSARAASAIVGKGGLGDALSELSKDMSDDAGKSGAIYQAIMEKNAAQTALMGDAVGSLDGVLDKIGPKIDDLTLKLSAHLTKALLPAASGVLMVIEGYQKLWGVLNLLSVQSNELFGRTDAAAYYREQADSAFKAAAESASLRKEISALTDTFGQEQQVVKQSAAALADQATALKGLAAQTGMSADAATAAGAKWKLVGGTWTQVATETKGAATEMRGLTAAVASVPREVNVKVTTTYVDVRTGSAPSGAEEGALQSVGSGPSGTSYGNWGGMFTGGV